MQDKSPNIGANLRDLRQEMGISLDKASELTGVSKAMLGQIERGESNPTVSTLWKISTGLKISFTALLDNNSECVVVKKEEVDFIPEVNGSMRLYPIFPFDLKNRFELFIIELDAGCHHVSATHNNVIREYIIVTDGEIEVEVEDKSYILSKGHSMSFDGNLRHSYKNIGSNKAVFNNIELYR